MTYKTMGEHIAALRRQQGMTQAELAEKMGVTDKAVSKWERNLSCPDVASMPQLAQIFGITVDELMQVTRQTPPEKTENIKAIVGTILKAIPVAMGASVTVLSVMDALEIRDAVTMLGLGLACAGVSLLRENR